MQTRPDCHQNILQPLRTGRAMAGMPAAGSRTQHFLLKQLVEIIYNKLDRKINFMKPQYLEIKATILWIKSVSSGRQTKDMIKHSVKYPFFCLTIFSKPHFHFNTNCEVVAFKWKITWEEYTVLLLRCKDCLILIYSPLEEWCLEHIHADY